MNLKAKSALFKYVLASVFTACAIIFALGAAVCADDSDRSVSVQVHNSDLTIPVKAIYKDGFHHLFLPSGTTDADVRYSEGDAASNYRIMTDCNVGSLHFFSTDPVNQGMKYIHGSSDHSTKASGSIVLLDEQLNLEYQGGVEAIKGRGNSTWRVSDKKPYQIKLEKKKNLLDPSSDSQKAKKWILLANALDDTMIRNRIAYSMAREMGIESTPEGRFVDLYYDGDYRGVYYLCEKVEIGEGRVDINDLDKKPEVFTGGYLLEIDNFYYRKEAVWFQTPSAGAVVIKSPEDITEEQRAYITAFVNEAMQCVQNAGRDANGDFKLFDYFDRDSCARFFLVMTGLRNGDAYQTSTFLYKPEDEDKLYFGPVWDFDHSMGRSNPKTTTEGWLLKRLANDLMKIPEFREAVQASYRSDMAPLFERLLYGTTTESELIPLSRMRSDLEYAGKMNLTLWGNLNQTAAQERYESSYTTIKTWLQNRYKWLNKTVLSESFLTDPYPPAASEQQGQAQQPDTTGNESGTAAVKNNSLSIPDKPKIAVKAKKGRIRVSWKKVPSASGYQVRYKKVNKNRKAKIKTTKKKSIWIKNLKRRTRYIVQVRSFRKMNGKRVYGNWSDKQVIKVK